MKKFNSVREESLLEKLKASDPTGKWISDFVHSDNPKFAGKSKKERIRMALGASYAAKRNEEVEQIDEVKHRVAVTVSDPNHSMVSKRKETMQKFVRISGDKDASVEKAKKHFSKQGYRVHGAEHVGMIGEDNELDEGMQQTLRKVVPGYAKKQINQKMDREKFGRRDVDKDANYYRYKKVLDKVKNEEVEQIDELKTSTMVRYSTKANKALLGGDRNKEQKRIKGIQTAIHKIKQKAKKTNEEFEIEEASVVKRHEELRKKSKLPHPDYYKELGKSYDIEDDKERLSKQSEIKKKYKVEEVMAEAKDPREYDYEGDMAKTQLRSIISNSKTVHDMLEDTTNLAEWVQSKITKAEDYIATVADYMQAEMNEQSIREGSIEGGAWTSKAPKKGQPEVDPPSAIVEPIDKNAKDTTTIKTGLGDLNKAFDKIDKENAAKAKKPVKEGNSFSKIRNKLAEAKKMKGPDPCWDNYEMIGTKMKNGKEVPNCVPKKK